MPRLTVLLTVLVLLDGLCLLVAMSSGSADTGLADISRYLAGDAPGNITYILDLRLDRAMSAFVAGALLAVAGVLMQVLLRNPLADPFVLGVSGGAAVGALGCVLLGLGAVWMPMGAFAGALGTMVLVFGLARSGGDWSPPRLLLTGVVIAAGWGAVINLMLAISPDDRLRGMVFWLMGDLSLTDGPGWMTGVLVLATLPPLLRARNLNLLAQGELRASALGVPVPPLRMMVYVCASLLTAAAVTLAGSIGFVGLITPHLLRLTVGPDHRLLLPASLLAGGGLVILADTLARTLLAPRQLPVGVVTALVGVPIFLALLRRRRGAVRL
ncbi:MAG: FecCD family ABC transporter permease [Gammaproteobacteria bacterium]